MVAENLPNAAMSLIKHFAASRRTAQTFKPNRRITSQNAGAKQVRIYGKRNGENTDALDGRNGGSSVAIHETSGRRACWASWI